MYPIISSLVSNSHHSVQNWWYICLQPERTRHWSPSWNSHRQIAQSSSFSLVSLAFLLNTITVLESRAGDTSSTIGKATAGPGFDVFGVVFDVVQVLFCSKKLLCLKLRKLFGKNMKVNNNARKSSRVRFAIVEASIEVANG